MRRLRQARSEGSSRSTASIILEASLEVRSPIFYATLIVVLAVVPVLFMQGLSGAFFQPLILSYVMAILASLLVAVTITPALCLLLLRRAPLSGKGSPLAAWLGRHYVRLLGRTTRTPRPAYVTVGLVTLAGVVIMAAARALAAAVVQGAGFPDALGDRSKHLASRDGPYHHRGEQGTARHPRRAQLRRPYRPGVPGRRGGRRQLRRELDQHRPARPTTTRRLPPFRNLWKAIRACTAICRPT